LDAVKKIPDLIEFAEDPGKLKIDKAVNWLRKHWM
jgi:hypothetical protein